MRISQRLQIVFDNLIPGLDVWDICCDHGYLAGAAYESQKFPNVFFVDQVPSIIEKAESIFHKYVLKIENPSKAHFFAKNAQDLNRIVNGNICITGVGAFTINEILVSLAANGFLDAKKLILGPHRDVEKLIEAIKCNESLKNYCLSLTVEFIEEGRSRPLLIYERNF